MTPDDLSRALFDLVNGLAERRRAAGDDVVLALTPEQVTLERPKLREHGDWASSIAMRVAKPLGSNPREIATELAATLAGIDGVASAEVAGPGFINIRLDAAAAGALAKAIVDAGPAYGHSDTLAGDGRINLEFVSANPTGPLHIGHTRWAALGDSIGRVLRAAGAEVANEYYINDAGTQMDNFGLSVLAAAKGEPTPEGGYPGSYIADLAARVLEREPKLLELDEAVALHTATEIAYELQLGEIRASLDRFNVHFDVWTSERRLQVKGDDGLSDVDTAVERLRAQGHVFDEDDAVWVRTTDFGDDKDRVIRRSNGAYTYFAADAAYYLDKGDRGFRHKIYLLGADHHGYVHRLQALAGAAGDDPERDIEVLIGQLVSINGAKLSKRAGNIIELDDLQAWLGTDALRYTLARYPADSPLTIDPEILHPPHERQPRVLRAVRPRAHGRGRPQRGIRRRRPLVVRARAARARDGVGAARRAAGVPAHRRPGRRAPRAAPRRALHRGARRALPPLVRQLPRAPARRRADRRPAPHAALAERRDRPGHPQRARPARRLRTGADVNDGRPRDDDEPLPTDAAGGTPTDDDLGATAVIPADEQATEVIRPATARRAAAAAPRPPAPPRSPAPQPAPAATPHPGRPPTGSRRGRAARIWITVVAIVVAVVALVVVADVIVRNIAEARFAEEIEANLPDGVEGDVGVTIGGLSVIAQYLSGTMQHVELSAPELDVEGVPIAVDVVGEGVPVDLALPVEHLTATIEADAAAVNRLIDVQGIEGELAFGDGTVGYTDSVRFLGFPIEFTVTARPTAAGDTVLLEPVGVEVAAGGGSIDVSGIVDRLLGDDPIPVCVAEHLPGRRRGAAAHGRAHGCERRPRGGRPPSRRGEPRDARQLRLTRPARRRHRFGPSAVPR